MRGTRSFLASFSRALEMLERISRNLSVSVNSVSLWLIIVAR